MNLRKPLLPIGAQGCVRITGNLGPTPFETGTGLLVPGYGFHVRKVDGSMIDGQFRHALELDGKPLPY